MTNSISSHHKTFTIHNGDITNNNLKKQASFDFTNLVAKHLNYLTILLKIPKFISLSHEHTNTYTVIVFSMQIYEITLQLTKANAVDLNNSFRGFTPE